LQSQREQWGSSSVLRAAKSLRSQWNGGFGADSLQGAKRWILTTIIIKGDRRGRSRRRARSAAK